MPEIISLGGFNELVKAKYGWMIYNKNDTYIGSSIREYGEWSSGEIEIIKQLVKPSDVVIELGSNIGAHTVPIAKLVPEGLVYAFEPQNIIFENLCANISINSLTNCICEKFALSDNKNENLCAPNSNFLKPENFGAAFLEKSKNNFNYSVPVETLDNKLSHLKSLKLVKMDIEGMELNALKGGVNLIKRTQPFLYFENDRKGDNSKKLIEYLWNLDYKLYWHVTRMFKKNNFFKNKKNIFDNQGSFNVVGIPKKIDVDVQLPLVEDSNFHPYWSKK